MEAATIDDITEMILGVGERASLRRVCSSCGERFRGLRILGGGSREVLAHRRSEAGNQGLRIPHTGFLSNSLQPEAVGSTSKDSVVFLKAGKRLARFREIHRQLPKMKVRLNHRAPLYLLFGVHTS